MTRCFLFLSVAAPVIWSLAIVTLAILALAGFILWNPGVLTKGQDAAGKGMFMGCAVAMLGGGALIVSVFNAILTAASDTPLDTATRIAGFGPLAGLLLAGLTAYIVTQIRRGK